MEPRGKKGRAVVRIAELSSESSQAPRYSAVESLGWPSLPSSLASHCGQLMRGQLMCAHAIHYRTFISNLSALVGLVYNNNYYEAEYPISLSITLNLTRLLALAFFNFLMLLSKLEVAY